MHSISEGVLPSLANVATLELSIRKEITPTGSKLERESLGIIKG